MGKIKLNDSILSKTLADQEVLIDLQSGNYFGMNETGTLLWAKIKTGATRDELAEILREKFGLNDKEAKSDVKEFLSALKRDSLIES